MQYVPRIPNESQKATNSTYILLYSKVKNFYELGKIIILWLKIVACTCMKLMRSVLYIFVI